MAEHFKWLVEQRCKTQKFLLELYQFGKTHEKKLKHKDSLSTSYLLLIGATFSLWRAVFLIPEQLEENSGKSWEDSFSTGMEFLKILIEDNAINYSQDKKTRKWSGGYYLNNAYFRLHKVCKELNSPSLEELLGDFDIAALEGDCSTFDKALDTAIDALKEIDMAIGE